MHSTQTTRYCGYATKLIGLQAIVLLTACVNGRSSIRPNGVMLDPRALTTNSAISQTITATDHRRDAAWWKAYGDPQLDQLVESAVVHNPTMTMAAARIRQMRAVFDTQHADESLTVTGLASVSGQRFSDNYGWGSYGGTWNSDNQLLLDVNYRFDFWGKRRATLAASQDRVHVSEAEAQDAALLLQTSLVETYIQLAVTYDLRALANEGLARRRQLLALAALRRQAGMDNSIDVTVLQSAITGTCSEIVRLDGEIDRLRHAVAALTGHDPSYADTLVRPALNHLSNPEPISSLPADLLGHRPDVVAARARVEAASQDIVAAKAAFYPDIDLSMFAGVQRLGLNELLTGGSFAAGVVPALSLPIFDGGRLRGQLKSRTADYDVAVSNYNAALLTALREVADGVTNLQAASRQKGAAEESVAQQQTLLELQRTRAEAAIASHIDLLNAEIALLLSQRNAADADARVAVRQVTLIRALGGSYSTPSSAKQ